jgi:hypothetical protein
VVFVELGVVQVKKHSKLHCAKCLERWILWGKSDNELVPKFRVVFAARLYFLQIRKHRKHGEGQARNASTYKNPGSCDLKHFPEKPPAAPAFKPASLL